MPPGSSDVGLFLEMGRHRLPKQFYKVYPLVYTNLFLCYCSRVLKSFAQGLFLNGTCIFKMLVLSKK